MELKLPPIVISQVDVARLLRELNSLEDFFTAANARSAGTPIVPPRVSRLLQDLATENRCNLLDKSHRQELGVLLGQVLKSAPLLHISFAVDPSPKVLERILVWLRENIHPQALLQVGLQPSIAAGCVLRTANKVFDMSLGEGLKKQEPYLAQLIAGAGNG